MALIKKTNPIKTPYNPAKATAIAEEKEQNSATQTLQNLANLRQPVRSVDNNVSNTEVSAVDNSATNLNNNLNSATTSNVVEQPKTEDIAQRQSRLEKYKAQVNDAWANQKAQINQSALNYQQELQNINQRASMYYDDYLKSLGLYGSGAGAGVYNEMNTNMQNAGMQIEANRQNQIENARNSNTEELKNMVQQALSAGATSQEIDDILNGYNPDSINANASTIIKDYEKLANISKRTKDEEEAKAQAKEDEAKLEAQRERVYAEYQAALDNEASDDALEKLLSQYAELGLDQNRLEAMKISSGIQKNKELSDEEKEKKAGKAKDLLTSVASALTAGDNLESIKENIVSKYGEDIADEYASEIEILGYLQGLQNTATSKADREEKLYDFIQTATSNGVDEEGFNEILDILENGIGKDGKYTTEALVKASVIASGLSGGGENVETIKNEDGTKTEVVTNENGTQTTITYDDKGKKIKEETKFPNGQSRTDSASEISREAYSDPDKIMAEIKGANNMVQSLGYYGNPDGSTLRALERAETTLTSDELATKYKEYYERYTPSNARNNSDAKELMELAQEKALEGKLPNGITIAPTYAYNGTYAAFTYYNGVWYVSNVTGVITFDAVFNKNDLIKLFGGSSSKNNYTSYTEDNSKTSTYQQLANEGYTLKW